MKKKSNLKYAINFLLSFLLMIFLIITMMLLIFSSALNRGFVLESMGNSNYYDAVKDTIVNKFESIAIQSGLPQNHLDKSVTDVMIYQDIVAQVDNTFKHTDIDVNVLPLKNQILSLLKEYTTSKNIAVTSNVKANMEGITNQCTEEYIKQVTIPFSKDVANFKLKYLSIINTFSLFFGILCVIILLILFFIQRWKHRIFEYASYSFMSAGLLTIISSLVILISKFYENIQIYPKSFYYLVCSLFNGITINSLVMGITVFVLGLCCIVLNVKLKYTSKK